MSGIGWYTYNLATNLIKEEQVKSSFFYGNKLSRDLFFQKSFLNQKINTFVRDYFPFSYYFKREYNQY